MAFTHACDRCGKVLEQGSGAPQSLARRLLHCEPCGALAAQVETTLREKYAGKAHALSLEMDMERERLFREYTPAKPGEVREGVQGGWTIQVPQ